MKIIDEARLQEAYASTLKAGNHAGWSSGACVMEAVAYVAGEPWSDHPECACPIIASFLRSWNDRLPVEQRQELKQYISPLIGSKTSPQIEQKRSWMLTDWAIRECAPLWLRRAGMNAQADTLFRMAPITGQDEFRSARPAIEAIREEVWPARLKWRAELTSKIKAKLAEANIADAAAAAVAASAADAVAVAAAVAAADDVADAVADAVAAAVADADDVADAVAAAVAAAVADRSCRIYWAVHSAVRDVIAGVVQKKLGDTYEQSYASAHVLVRRLLEVK